MTHYNLVHKFVPTLQAMKFLKSKKRGYSESSYIDGHLSAQKCGVRTKVPKVQRTSRAPKWRCKRRLRLIGCIHRTRFESISNDGRKSNGCHCKPARLCRTSSRRSISLYSSKNGGRSKIAQNSEVRMSRYVDTSSTTQVAQIMVKHWRSCGSSWATFVRSHTCRLLLKKTISIEVRLGEGFQLGMLIRTPWKRIFLICVVGWHWNGWKKAEFESLVEEIDDAGWSGRIDFRDQVYSECVQRECKPNQNIEEYRNMFESRSNWEITWVGKTHAKTVAWSYNMEGRAKKVRWKMLWAGE